MSNFLEFTVPLKPVGSSQFALLEDVFLQGSYRVLERYDDLDFVDFTTAKIGMLVKCLDVNKTYVLTGIVSEEDDFGDPITEYSWEEFTISLANGQQKTNLARWIITLSFNLEPSGEKSTRLPFARAIILERITASDLCSIEFKEADTEIVIDEYTTFNNKIEHTFSNINDLVYSNIFTFPDGTPLNTRYTQLMINKDTLRDKFYYFNIKNNSNEEKTIEMTFFVLAIHT